MLSVHHNELLQLPDSIGRLSCLRSLLAYHNALASLPDTLPSLGPCLTELDVSSNDLSALPHTIDSLTNLRLLDLFDNLLPNPPKDVEWHTELDELKFYARLAKQVTP